MYSWAEKLFTKEEYCRLGVDSTSDVAYFMSDHSRGSCSTLWSPIAMYALIKHGLLHCFPLLPSVHHLLSILLVNVALNLRSVLRAEYCTVWAERCCGEERVVRS